MTNNNNQANPIYLEVNLSSCPFHRQVGQMTRTFTNFKGEPCAELYMFLEDEFVKFNMRVLSSVKERK